MCVGGRLDCGLEEEEDGCALGVDFGTLEDILLFFGKFGEEKVAEKSIILDIGIVGVGNEVAVVGGCEELLVGSGSEHGRCDALVPVPDRSFVGEEGSVLGDGNRLVRGSLIVGDCLKEGLKFGVKL